MSGLSPSAHCAKPEPSPAEAGLRGTIETICQAFPGYGYRRVTHELRHRVEVVNRKRVLRLMRQQGLSAKPRKRFCVTTDSDHGLPVYPNLYRNQIPARPDRIWVADITYIRLLTGFAFLAAILDACSRKVVGYASARTMSTRLTLAALEMAIEHRELAPVLIHHSDQGSQYAAKDYRDTPAGSALWVDESQGKSLRQSPGREFHEDLEARGDTDQWL